MASIFKSVAMLLAITLLAAPAAALTSCWTRSGEAQHGCCDPDSPMMAMMNHQHAADTIQAVASGASCYDLSSGKAMPATQVQVPTRRLRTAVTPPQSAGVFAAVLGSAGSDSPPSTPSLPPASPQAVLCTFLI
jgi:hypothetical protein